MNNRGLILGVIGLMGLSPQRAGAYDSQSRSRTDSLPMSSIQFQPPPIHPRSNTDVRHDIHLFTYALGAKSPRGLDDTGVVEVFVCNKAMMDQDVPDLSACRVVVPGDLDYAGYGWLNARLKWDSPDGAEHLHLSTAAATIAGLVSSGQLETNKLFERTFVRYPTDNQYLIAPIKRHGVEPPEQGYGSLSDLIVAPSWKPTGFEDARSFVVRGFSLLELSQLPDFTYNVASWAAGNELCPLSLDVEENVQLFKGKSNLTACYDYNALLGPLNTSHFLPHARNVYQYYHGLALERMEDCKAINDVLGSFYENWSGIEVFHGQTEAHECEREAFVYEMFAQHYLQDAWSSGHMWKRYGGLDFPEYPDVVQSLEPTGDFVLAEGNRPFRRAAVASVLALQSGMVHGAKAVLIDLVEPLGRDLFDALGVTDLFCADGGCNTLQWADSRGLIDDPLCGPQYFSHRNPFEPMDVEYVPGTADVGWDQSPRSGAGDMFWNPPFPKARIAVDPKYELQRARLLGCAAASMRAVYERGPMVHGTPAPVGSVLGFFEEGEAVPISDIDPTNDDCWGQWATNDAMWGALGAFGGAEAQGGLALRFGFMDFVNELSFEKAVFPEALSNGRLHPAYGAVNFPAGSVGDANDGPERDARQDRDDFRQRVIKALESDVAAQRTAFFSNSYSDPNGTDSARGLTHAGTQIRFLGFSPNSDLPPEGTPMPYADQIVRDVDLPQGNADVELHFAVNNMFWRSHAKETCEETAEGTVLADLRTRCTSSAASGGDPAACTACVALAELHFPSCDSATTPAVGQSKCEALGAPRLEGDAYSWWYDSALRTSFPGTPLGTADGYLSDASMCDYPPFYAAFHWCTGTYSEPLGSYSPGSTVAEVRSPMVVTDTLQCGEFLQITRQWGHREDRVGIVIDEEPGGQDYPEGSAYPFVFPTVSAIAETVTTHPSSEPCGLYPNGATTGELDSVAGEMVAPATIWDNTDWDIYAETGHNLDLRLRRCGVVQRVSGWNKPCDDVATLMGVEELQNGIDVPFDPVTGLETQSHSYGCMLREPRTFMHTCTGATDAQTCTSMGYCVQDAPLSFRVMDVNHRLTDF